jgi:nitrate reductase delta subunit
MKSGLFTKDASQLEYVERVKSLTRERFELSADIPIRVLELGCGSPGCPPLETTVTFWTSDTTRHHFKVFKPTAQVIADDLPFRWMKNSIILPDGMGCDCC